MRNKADHEKLEQLLADIHADSHESGYEGQACLSPMLGETADTDNDEISEGDDYDELFT